jgi:hypothetical protein
MFRLYMSHLQALKGQIHTVNEQYIVKSHNSLLTHCMDLTLEGLKMTQKESKHVALIM